MSKKQNYKDRFLAKKTISRRRNISIADDVYQKLSYIHGACLLKQIQFSAYIGHIINDHIEQYKDTIIEISKEIRTSIDL